MRVTLSVMLGLAGAFLWWAGGREREIASAQQALVTLQFDEAARRFAALEEQGVINRLFGRVWPRPEDVGGGHALVRYWRASSSGAVAAAGDPASRDRTQSRSGDAGRATGLPAPSLSRAPARQAERPVDRTTGRFLLANAAYREATASGGDWRTVVARLDGVIEQYAAILRDDPGHRDAAFNYEFLVRYRAAIAARQRDVLPAGIDEPVVTIHGIEGIPPPGTGMKGFRMLVPMQPDERREAEEAGRGGRRIRKG